MCRRRRKIVRREERVARGGCRAVVFDKTTLSNIDLKPGGFSSHTCVSLFTHFSPDHARLRTRQE